MFKKGDYVYLKNGDIDVIKKRVGIEKHFYEFEYTDDDYEEEDLRLINEDEFSKITAKLKFKIGDYVVEKDETDSIAFAKEHIASGRIVCFAIINLDTYYKISSSPNRFYRVAELDLAVVQSDEEVRKLKNEGKEIIGKERILKYVQIAKKRKLSDIYLNEIVEKNVFNFIKRYEKRNLIKQAGFDSMRYTILMAGPPGNGKSVLASAIANAIGFDCYLVDMSNIRSALNGETGKNVGELFDIINQVSMAGCVLFLDECDSIATKRSYRGGAEKDDSAALNIVLTKLDNLDENVIVIAATNYKDELDGAFSRRFLMTLYLDKPDDEHISKYVHDYFKKYGIKNNLIFDRNDISDIIDKSSGKSWSHIEEMCKNHVMKTLLGNELSIDKGWIGLNTNKLKKSVGFITK